jgi:hypothetical protein
MSQRYFILNIVWFILRSLLKCANVTACGEYSYHWGLNG